MGFFSQLKKMWIIRSSSSSWKFSGTEYDPIQDTFVHSYKSSASTKKSSSKKSVKESTPHHSSKASVWGSRLSRLRLTLSFIISLVIFLQWISVTFSADFLRWIVRKIIFRLLFIFMIYFIRKYVRTFIYFIIIFAVQIVLITFPYRQWHSTDVSNSPWTTTNSVIDQSKSEWACFRPWCVRAPSDFVQDMTANYRTKYMNSTEKIPNYCCVTVQRDSEGKIEGMAIDETPLILKWTKWVELPNSQ